MAYDSDNFSVGPIPGFAREGTVTGVNLNRGTMNIKLNLAKSDKQTFRDIEVEIPAAWTGPNGEWAGGCPARGSTVWAVLATGGRWTVLNYVPSDGAFGNRNTPDSGFSTSKNILASLKPGRYVSQVKNNIRHLLDPNIGIQFGSPVDFVHADPTTSVSKRSIYSYKFKQSFAFTDASRKIEGPVKRDKSSNSLRDISGSALTSHSYDSSLTTIGLDPVTAAGPAFIRNPPFIESRKVVYEYAFSYGYTTDSEEAAEYDTNIPPDISETFKRRDSRADVLSLSLVEPNQLMERIAGTVVDIYGNILDINRNKLPNGLVDELNLKSNAENQSETFVNLLAQTRKSIAYHFELNARKSEVPSRGSYFPESDSLIDYARDRSRLSFDVDKEGQFKLNVPASSETGNVGLLTRYENYSTLKAFEDDTDPRNFVRNSTETDIFLESYGVGVVSLTGDDQALEGFSAPVDRITDIPIKLGTAYHNLQDTLQIHNRSLEGNDLLPVQVYADSLLNDTSLIPPPGDVVTSNITVSGPNANAGGRSGTINFDGMISCNIGANTVDRQSLWFDTAGGIVANVGRDVFDRSLAARFDGDILVQIGGTTVSNDSRFKNLNNGVKDGVLDIRVVNNAQMHIIRIDKTGVSIASSGRLDIFSAQDMKFTALGDMIFDAEGIYMYGKRWIKREGTKTI